MHTSLLTLLSFSLVSFTIELDNEFEHRSVHRTTVRHPGSSEQRGPWLTSFAMYANCLEFLGESAISVRSLESLARSETNLDGMRRWGYIRLMPPPGKPVSKRPNGKWLIELTGIGRIVRETWRPLPELIEERWCKRFGAAALDDLRDALLEVNSAFDQAFPDFPPILGYGLFTLRRDSSHTQVFPPYTAAPLTKQSPLTALLSRPICAYACEFERESPVSLAISANILCLLDNPVPYKELPQRTGISREAISMAAGFLQKAGLIATTKGAGKIIRLTPRGEDVRRDASARMCAIEERWERTFGKETIGRLHQAFDRIYGDIQDPSAGLLQGLRPYADNWRASIPAKSTLPCFPVVLHRGGYPDGS